MTPSDFDRLRQASDIVRTRLSAADVLRKHIDATELVRRNQHAIESAMRAAEAVTTLQIYLKQQDSSQVAEYLQDAARVAERLNNVRALIAGPDIFQMAQAATEMVEAQRSVTNYLKAIRAVPAAERPIFGARVNDLKDQVSELREEVQQLLKQLASSQTDALDVTLPGRPLRRGRLHPVTQVRREILDIFARLGFATVEGPEVELDEYNFGRLRIPEHHPARDMWDTFWLDEEVDGRQPLLLRTHTSPMQIRHIDTHEPPIRVAVPGRCYRYEATDATHEWMLEQVELLAIDEGLSLANLKGTLQEFARQMFGPERRVLMRNSYFPFVEPGVELAVDCFACPGDNPACPVCRGAGWLEIMGAGMVHPEIIAAAGYDPERYTGFAAGMGVERITMLKFGITDIRDLHANDLRFLAQF